MDAVVLGKHAKALLSKALQQFRVRARAAERSIYKERERGQATRAI